MMNVPLQVWCFSLADDHKCHLVTRMDLHKMQKRLERQLDTAANRAGDKLNADCGHTAAREKRTTNKRTILNR